MSESDPFVNSISNFSMDSLTDIATIEEDSADLSSSNLTLQRIKRRASQARHRESVASCHKRLRRVVPFCDSKARKESCKSSVNKANLLKHAKNYVSHLEHSLDIIMHKKNSIKLEDAKSNLPPEMLNFSGINDYREYFAKRFNPQSKWNDYFGIMKTEYPNFKQDAFGWSPMKNERSKTKSISAHSSPSLSEDQGFVSANSQESYNKEVTLPIHKVKIHNPVQEYYVLSNTMVRGQAKCGFTDNGQYVMAFNSNPLAYHGVNNCVDIIQAIASPEVENKPKRSKKRQIH